MNQDEWRKTIGDWWSEIDAQALASKDSQAATLLLLERFRELNEDTMPVAAAVLGEWVLSTNSRQRFDALAVVQEFRLVSAVSQLRELESRLSVIAGPEALFEAKKVRALLALLTPQAAE